MTLRRYTVGAPPRQLCRSAFGLVPLFSGGLSAPQALIGAPGARRERFVPRHRKESGCHRQRRSASWPCRRRGWATRARRPRSASGVPSMTPARSQPHRRVWRKPCYEEDHTITRGARRNGGSAASRSGTDDANRVPVTDSSGKIAVLAADLDRRGAGVQIPLRQQGYCIIGSLKRGRTGLGGVRSEAVPSPTSSPMSQEVGLASLPLSPAVGGHQSITLVRERRNCPGWRVAIIRAAVRLHAPGRPLRR